MTDGSHRLTLLRTVEHRNCETDLVNRLLLLYCDLAHATVQT